MTSENSYQGDPPFFTHLAVVGVGLIGGSLARAVREKGLVGRIAGIGRGEKNMRKALELGVIDEIAPSLSQGVATADLVVLATPVCSIPPLIKEIAPFLKAGAIVTDVGSVKGPIVSEAERIYEAPSPFVGGHLIAGTENSGVVSSFPTLFQKRKCILTPTEKTDLQALEKVKLLWTKVGAEVMSMNVAEHDRAMGLISHLPHIVAYALVNTVDRIERRGETVSRFSAGGFKDFTRIASSHPEMWRDICIMNRDFILDAVEEFAVTVNELKGLLEENDGKGLEREFASARRARACVLNKER